MRYRVSDVAMIQRSWYVEAKDADEALQIACDEGMPEDEEITEELLECSNYEVEAEG